MQSEEPKITLRRKGQQNAELIARQEMAREWIMAVTGRNLKQSLQAELKDGLILCDLINIIQPRAVSREIRKTSSAFRMMQNLEFFIEACKDYGVNPVFAPQDLVNGKNFKDVVYCIHSLASIAANKGFHPTMEEVVGSSPEESLLKIPKPPSRRPSLEPVFKKEEKKQMESTEHEATERIYDRLEAEQKREEYHEDDDELSEEEYEEEYISDSELSLEEQLSREKERYRKAKQTIADLVANIDEYRQALEADRNEIEQTLKREINDEREKMEQIINELMADNEELQDTLKEYELRIKELEEERSRKNRENMENLQTLLKEMTIIEESNENLSKEYEEEKEHHNLTREKLQTSEAIIDQLELKMRKLEQELLNLQNQDSSKQFSLDADSLAALKGMEDNSLVKEILVLKQELEEERNRMNSIDALLSQARKVTTFGKVQEGGEIDTANALQEEKNAHKQTRKQLEETTVKYEKEIEILKRRVTGLIKLYESYDGSRPKTPAKSKGENNGTSVAPNPANSAPRRRGTSFMGRKDSKRELKKQPSSDLIISEPENFRRLTEESLPDYSSGSSFFGSDKKEKKEKKDKSKKSSGWKTRIRKQRESTEIPISEPNNFHQVKE